MATPLINIDKQIELHLPLVEKVLRKYFFPAKTSSENLKSTDEYSHALDGLEKGILTFKSGTGRTFENHAWKTIKGKVIDYRRSKYHRSTNITDPDEIIQDSDLDSKDDKFKNYKGNEIYGEWTKDDDYIERASSTDTTNELSEDLKTPEVLQEEYDRNLERSRALADFEEPEPSIYQGIREGYTPAELSRIYNTYPQKIRDIFEKIERRVRKRLSIFESF